MQGVAQEQGQPRAPEGMDHGDMQMPGVHGADDRPPPGGIEMADTELRDGSLPQVKQLAQQIVDAPAG
jgi:hypothetical protein